MKREITEKMINDLNDLGNMMTVLKWPEVTGNLQTSLSAKKVYKELMDGYLKVMRLEGDFYGCVNELCLKCGDYRTEHEGSCDGCRWKALRKGWTDEQG